MNKQNICSLNIIHNAYEIHVFYWIFLIYYFLKSYKY